jgi:hypothetical protein
MSTTERTAARARAATPDVLRRVDEVAARLEARWEPLTPRMKLGVALAAVFAGAIVINVIGSGIAGVTAGRPAPAQSTASRAVPAPVLESAPADTGKTWAVVKVWSGPGGRETESFTVGEHWRVDWLFNPTQPTAQLQVYIYAADGRLLLNVATNTQRAGADTSFWAGPGTYFLKVSATGGDWKLDVQELR